MECVCASPLNLALVRMAFSPSKVGLTAKMQNRSCRAILIPSNMYMAWKQDVFFARSTPFLLLQRRRIGKSVLTAKWIIRSKSTLSAPSSMRTDRHLDWEIRFNRKMDYKIKKYVECPIKYENGQAFIDYINENRHLLKNRPQVYQHGDYHIGNMMIDRGGQLHVIDFNRNDYGDPWEEFNRIVWCAQKAPLFASGMVNGYCILWSCVVRLFRK